MVCRIQEGSSKIQEYRENGFPFIQFNEVSAPAGDTFESLKILKEQDVLPNMPKSMTQILEAMPLIGEISYSIGIPPDVIFDKELSWLEAADRSNAISHKRANLQQQINEEDQTE